MVIIIIFTILSGCPGCGHRHHYTYDHNLDELCNTICYCSCNDTTTIMIARVWEGGVFKGSKYIDAAAVYNHCCWVLKCEGSGLVCATDYLGSNNKRGFRILPDIVLLSGVF